MKKIVVITAFLAFFASTNSVAQSFSERVVFHRGFFIGMHETQRSAETLFNHTGGDSTTRVGGVRRNYQFGLNWGTSVLLFAINDENSIRLAASLAGSIFSTSLLPDEFDELTLDMGFGLQIPLVVNYHFGHVATKKSVKDHGFNVGLGVEINRFSSHANELHAETSWTSVYNGKKITGKQSNFVQPVLSLGYQYWNASDLVRSLNLQVGFGASHELEGTTYYRPSVRLSLHKYIKY